MKNARMDEFETFEGSVYPGLTTMQQRVTDRYRIKSGIVRHKLGIVEFWQSISKMRDKPGPLLHLTVCHDGTKYERRWEAWYGEKTIARLANEFIDEIIPEKEWYPVLH